MEKEELITLPAALAGVQGFAGELFCGASQHVLNFLPGILSPPALLCQKVLQVSLDDLFINFQITHLFFPKVASTYSADRISSQQDQL